MVGLLHNLQVANTLSTPIFLNFYLLKLIFHLGCPGPRPAAPLQQDPQLLHVGSLSVLKPDPSASPAWWYHYSFYCLGSLVWRI